MTDAPRVPRANALTPERLAAAERRTQTARLYLQGLPQMEIGRRLGLNQSTVSRHLRALHKEWLAQRVRDLDVHMAQALARIDLVEQQAWAEWERSKQTCETTVTEQQQGGTSRGGRKAKVQKIAKGQCGDPRYLQIIHDCIDRRAKLLGLYAPATLIHAGDHDQPVEFTFQLNRPEPDAEP